MNIIITKLDQTENSTVSKLYVNARFICFIIEDGERENKIHSQTRIDAGQYTIKRFHQSRFKREWGYAWKLQDTIRHKDIVIHPGNFIDDTAGCLLPNARIGLVSNIWRGHGSVMAYNQLMEVLQQDEEHQIFIIR